ncbi:MAG TPA: lipopolysaccharide kinase InaA family protein [Myxococcota bacterium]|jgi:tRNA A-37 threonylcarbamoyl transferase component Bud32
MSPRLRFLAGDPAWRETLAPLLLDPAGSPGALTLLREQPGHRRLLRARLASGDTVFLKHFGRGRHRVREAVKGVLGLQAARREWRALVSLHARGVRVPEPLALASLGGGAFVIATRFVEGRTLKQTLAEQPTGRRALLLAVGDLIAALHAAGWTHGDLHHGNLLVGAGGVWLVDLQAALPLRAGPARWRDLGELDHSLAGALSRAERVRLRARALGLARPFDADARRSLRSVGRASDARARAYAHSRTRRARRPGRRYARLRVGRCEGLRFQRIDEAVVLKALEAHRAALAEGGPRVIQQRLRSSATRVEVAGVRVVVKEWQRRGPWRLAADFFRGSPAARAWRGGVGLRARRIGAAVPYAFLERRRLALPIACWLLLEDLRPAVPADVAAGGPGAPQVAQALATLLARLHRAGIRHGDLKASHVYLSTDGAGRLEARLIDLEGVRFGGRLPDRARIRELAQLNASLPDELSDTIRCSAFHRYASALPFRAPAETCLRRVVEESLARAHRWSGRGCQLARRPG